MDYGTVLGHGAYLGPDYTAEALHWMTETMRQEKAPGYDTLGVGPKAAVDAEVAQELKQNRYANGVLRFTAGEAAGWNTIVERYDRLFVEGQIERSLPKGALLPASEGGGDPRRSRRHRKSWPPSLRGRPGSPPPSAPRRTTPTPITGLTIRRPVTPSPQVP